MDPVKDDILCESINQSLKNLYGVDTVTGLAMWRVVWTNDQREYKLGDYTDRDASGNYLKEVREVRLVPKYAYARDRYILEQLVVLTPEAQEELVNQKLSYEGLFTFENQKSGSFLPPDLEVAEIVIDMIRAATGQESLAGKYLQTSDQKRLETIQRVNKIEEYLFGEDPEFTEKDSSTVILNSSGKLHRVH